MAGAACSKMSSGDRGSSGEAAGDVGRSAKRVDLTLAMHDQCRLRQSRDDLSRFRSCHVWALRSLIARALSQLVARESRPSCLLSHLRRDERPSSNCSSLPKQAVIARPPPASPTLTSPAMISGLYHLTPRHLPTSASFIAHRLAFLTLAARAPSRSPVSCLDSA